VFSFTPGTHWIGGWVSDLYPEGTISSGELYNKRPIEVHFLWDVEASFCVVLWGKW